MFFLFDNLRKKRPVTLTKWSGIACFKNSYGTLVENRCSRPKEGHPIITCCTEPGGGKYRKGSWERRITLYKGEDPVLIIL